MNSDVIDTPGARGPRALWPVPYEIHSALKSMEWRDGFIWPVAYSSLRDIQMTTASSLLSTIASMSSSRARALALLVQGSLGSLIRMIGEQALLADAARQQGIQMVGTAPEFEYLCGFVPLSSLLDSVPSLENDENIKLAFGRRMVRIASWTRSPIRLVRALVKPDHVVVSHNRLLRDVAHRSETAISFQHAESILFRGRSLTPQNGDDDIVDEVAERYERVIGQTYALKSEMHERMRALYRLRSRVVLTEAARDLRGLSQLRRVPRSIWAGSAGSYAVRALAIEVRRRGGATEGFDHGGSLSMVDDPDQIALREFSVYDRYVFPTAGCVDAVTKTGALNGSLPFGPTRLVGGAGDPTFRVTSRSDANGSRRRRRVYYVPMIFRGLRQHLPTYLPDPVYLDWQYRLVESLKRIDVDVVCKPHPEGLLKGRRHPLEAVCAIEYRKFEEVRDDADAFLFDISQSTTFWEAVCTHRPVVLIDLGITRFNTTVEPLIRRRCRIVKARWDERNLPSVDSDELADALCGTEKVDPTEFRMLLTDRA